LSRIKFQPVGRRQDSGMCGIFLVFERGRPVDVARALEATGALRHRGPDGDGHHAFTRTYAELRGEVTIGCFIGHTRLSILDLSDRSSQPFRRRGMALAYNGEIYNFRELRRDLERAGTTFESDGDTEVLFELVGQGGAEALRAANGMWAFCLVDEASGIVTAVRDRYGKKPLFYYVDAQTLCVASEIAPIFAYLDRRPALVASELDSFLRHGWLFPHSDGSTHIESIRQVPAGAALRFDLAAWMEHQSRWFDLAAFAAAEQVSRQGLADVVDDAVMGRLVSDRNVALLLSGGVDSSLILSVLAARGLHRDIRCFTGDAGKSDDAEYARRCIEALGIHQVSVPLDYGPAGLERFLQVCRHQEKPFPFIGNALAMPQLYERIAEHDVPVVLDGTGGDEFFGGYWYRYYRFAIAEAVAAGDEEWLESSLSANADEITIHAIADRAMREARQRSRPALPRPGLVGSARDPADLDAFVRPSVRVAHSTDPLESFRGTLGEALVVDAAQGRLHEWLWQNDRNAMMSGIENRSPFLDYRLASFMLSGYRSKFVGCWNKHELRSLFSTFVPLPTQWRRDKQGFRWVYSRFVRRNRDEVVELIARSRILPECIDVDRLLERARADDAYLVSSLMERMLCIAGLEETMGLTLAASAARKVA
jgi:asparagine synthase (glutamine-hydrolysing)